MSTKVAVVTGANKGIGFAIVRGLCKRFPGAVYLTSRDEARGRSAVAALQQEGLSPLFHQLDVTDEESVQRFRDHVQAAHGGIDVLVNNAAIAFKQSAPEPPAEQARETLRVNYFSLVRTCEILVPVVRSGGRVVLLSSWCGLLLQIPSEALRQRLGDPHLTLQELNKLMQRYVDEAQKGTHEAEWGKSSYAVSKVGVSAYSDLLQRMVNDRDIKVNAVHPGYVDTDMTSHKGNLSIDEGAVSALFCALDAPDSLKGGFVWSDATVTDWKTRPL